MRKIYTKKNICIYERKTAGEYIVHNTNKEWNNGHTHIRTYKQALYLSDCILASKLPHNVNKYFLISLIRLSNNDKYTAQLESKIQSLHNKSQYKNKPKGFKW